MRYEKLKANDFHKYPFVRLIFPLIAGILLQQKFNFSVQPFLYALFSLLFIALILSISRKYAASYRYRWIYGIIANITLIILGIYITDLKTIRPAENIFPNNEASYIATVIETPQEKAKSFKTTIQVNSRADSNTSQIIDYKAIAYFQKDSISQKLKYGDRLIINGYVNEVKNAGNPHEFDYKQFLAQKGILYQTYVASDKWKLLSENHGDIFTRYAKKMQHGLLNIYKSHNFDSQEFAVVAALTLGYKNELDQETREAYAASGAMHILAVSGLHVGIIYMIINFLLSFLDKNRKLKPLKAIIIIISLWLFAYISGLSPSVKRSALMFSLITFGGMLDRNSNIYNTISASAFFLLIFNPFNINSVGFLLSYSAVISIVYFQPKIYNIFYVKNWLLDKLWALLTVSFAAQLGTMPISFLFFHQFPNYFFITNIIVIPLASIILYTAIALFAVSWIPHIGVFTAFLLKKIVWGLNFSVNFIESLPYSTTKDIFLSPTEVIIFYILIYIAGLFFIFKEKKYLISSFAIIIVWLGVAGIQKYNFLSDKKLYAYNIRKSCAINIVNRNENILFCDSTILNDHKIIDFSIKNNWLYNGYKKGSLQNIDSISNEFESVEVKNSIFNYGKLKFAVVRNNDLTDFFAKEKLKVDFVLLSNNVYLSMEDVDALFDTEKIVFDASNKYWRIKKWKEQCEELEIPYFSIPDEGAYKVVF